MSDIIEITIQDYPCFKSPKYNSYIKKSLYNEIYKISPISVDELLENLKDGVVITAYTHNTDNDKEGFVNVRYMSGRISKNDEKNRFSIEESVYFLKDDIGKESVDKQRIVIRDDKVFKTYDEVCSRFNELYVSKKKNDKFDMFRTISGSEPLDEKKIVDAWSSIPEKATEKPAAVTPLEKPVEKNEPIPIVEGPFVDTISTVSITHPDNIEVMSKYMTKNLDMFVKDSETYVIAFKNFYIDFNMISKIKKVSVDKKSFEHLMKAYYFTKFLMSKSHYNEVVNKVSDKFGLPSEMIKDWIGSINSYRGHSKVKVNKA